jgi:hypothetical protein
MKFIERKELILKVIKNIENCVKQINYEVIGMHNINLTKGKLTPNDFISKTRKEKNKCWKEMKKTVENNTLASHINTFESTRNMLIKTKIDALKLNL